MAYIGNDPSNRFVAPKAASVFSGDGSTTAFTLDHAVGSDEDILVSVDGVIQEPSVAYAVSNGTTLTFTAAPSSNSGNNIFVYYLFRTVGTVSHPSNNALSASDITVDTTTLVTDSTNNRVGIGIASPDGTLHVHSASAGSVTADSEGDELVVENNGNGGISILTPDTARSALFLGHTSDNNKIQIRHDGNTSLGAFISDSTLTTFVGGSEHMRIDTSGNIMFNSGVYATADARLVTTHDGNAQVGFTIRSTSSVAQSEKMIQFKKDNTSGVTEVGTITSNRTSTAYNTSSDYRLKENVTADWDATTRLKKLNPVRFNFIVDADTTVDGFLAHEVQSIVPEAVTGTHNEVDDDDNPVYQGIDQSKLVPLLVKSLQEALAEIDTLKTKVAALESK